MSDRATTRSRLIEAGLPALLAGGYEGAGIGPVLRDADVPKGSFYHHFGSKEEFVRAVLEQYAARGRGRRQAVLGDADTPPLARLRRYFQTLIDHYAAQRVIDGCLIGRLSHEAAGRHTALRDDLAAAFRAWERDFIALLREARGAGDLAPGVEPDETAAFLIDAWEGALVRAKAEGSVEPLRRFVRLAVDPLGRA